MYLNVDFFFFLQKSERQGPQTRSWRPTNSPISFAYRLRQNIQFIDLPSGWFLVHFLVKTRKTIRGTVKQVPLKWAARACSKNNQSEFPRNLPPLIITLLRQALSLARTLSSSQVNWAIDHTPSNKKLLLTVFLGSAYIMYGGSETKN